MNSFNNLSPRLREGELNQRHALRHTRHQNSASRVPTLNLGQHISPTITATVGSLRFIIIQDCILLAWMVLNVRPMFGNGIPTLSS
ncbi:MAG: hypothetical protein EXR01_07600 [Acetobacteraceae bacterium]|nr:hypothetical protein [Acetobacteraceae bacterium]